MGQRSQARPWGRKSRPKFRCPICGQPGYGIYAEKRGRSVVYRFKHAGLGGRYWCYIGTELPAELAHMVRGQAAKGSPEGPQEIPRPSPEARQLELAEPLSLGPLAREALEALVAYYAGTSVGALRRALRVLRAVLEGRAEDVRAELAKLRAKKPRGRGP